MTELGLHQSKSLAAGTDYRPVTGSPLPGAASFEDERVAAGFERVSYAGAFGEHENGLEGWTEFDPQHADYRSAPVANRERQMLRPRFCRGLSCVRVRQS